MLHALYPYACAGSVFSIDYKKLYESLDLFEKFKPQIYKYLVATAEHS